MRRYRFSGGLAGLLALVLLTAACTPTQPTAPAAPTAPAPAAKPPAPAATAPSPSAASSPAAASKAAAPAASQADWQQLIQAAQAEGTLSLALHDWDGIAPIAQAFQARFPQIKVDFTQANIATMSTRIVLEQQNGQYLWDLVLAPDSSVVQVMTPAGAFQPLPPLFVLPEVTDDKNWHGGASLYAQDVTNQPLTFIYSLFVSGGISVNHDVIPEGDFAGVDDLLNPRWKGKILIDDPSAPRSGALELATIAKAKGKDFVRRLLTEQEPVFSDNDRIQSEWWATGRYPILIPERTGGTEAFRAAGVLKKSKIYDPRNVATVGISVLKNAPHPNATKVFLNWFLSQEGQQAYVDGWAQSSTKERSTSRHAGVKPRSDIDPQLVPDWSRLSSYAAPNDEKDGVWVSEVMQMYQELKR